MDNSWERVYHMLEPAQLPWNAGGPDSDLARWLESGKIPLGRAVDLGAGLGHDAIFLAQKGFQVLAVDIAAGAVKMACASASLAEVGGQIEFRAEDALKLSVPEASLALAVDRGLFHFISPADRQTYIGLVVRALAPRGYFFLKTFSEKEPPGPGPARFTQKQLEELFSPHFDFLEFKDSVFAGPAKPKAYFSMLQKKS